MTLEISASKESTADWIETSLLARGKPIGRDALVAFASEEINASAGQVGLAFSVLNARHRILGSDYPFDPMDIAVRVKANAMSLPYSLFLLLTPKSPSRLLLNRGPSPNSVALFENAVSLAMKKLLGPDSQSVRFGWPSSEGQPAEFNLAIAWLAEKMGLQPGSFFRPPRRNDAGVDVVAWRPFSDGKIGFPICLTQCTIQDNFIQKSADIDVRMWSPWLGLEVDPSTALAVPGTVSKIVDWNEMTVRGMVLDRIRLSSLLSGVHADEIPGAIDFIEEQVAGLRSLLVASQE